MATLRLTRSAIAIIERSRLEKRTAPELIYRRALNDNYIHKPEVGLQFRPRDVFLFWLKDYLKNRTAIYFGCGRGKSLIDYKEAGIDMVGVDKKRISGQYANVVQGDARWFPWRRSDAPQVRDPWGFKSRSSEKVAMFINPVEHWERGAYWACQAMSWALAHGIPVLLLCQTSQYSQLTMMTALAGKKVHVPEPDYGGWAVYELKPWNAERQLSFIRGQWLTYYDARQAKPNDDLVTQSAYIVEHALGDRREAQKTDKAMRKLIKEQS